MVYTAPVNATGVVHAAPLLEDFQSFWVEPQLLAPGSLRLDSKMIWLAFEKMTGLSSLQPAEFMENAVGVEYELSPVLLEK